MALADQIGSTYHLAPTNGLSTRTMFTALELALDDEYTELEDTELTIDTELTELTEDTEFFELIDTELTADDLDELDTGISIGYALSSKVRKPAENQRPATGAFGIAPDITVPLASLRE